MTTNRSRGIVVALVTILTWSVVLGAAMPAVAGGSSSHGGSAVQYSLDIGGTVGDTVDTVTSDVDEPDASGAGGEPGPNATETANSSEDPVTDAPDRTTGGLEATVEEVVQTRTPTPAPTPAAPDERDETATAEPDATATP